MSKRHEDEAKVFALRRAVSIEATSKVYGYCSGQSEKADHHVANILPALCRVLGITEVELAAMRPNINTGN
jgi:hypothetical protein